MEKLLYKENISAVRKAGFELALKFLDVLEDLDSPLVSIMQTSITLEPLLTQYSSNIIQVLPYKALSCK